ncbi:hypothetical protein [Herpetosiphon giganteus]|uniref:hypothetical protein n=1 Tax=Herpetosiphon giganteus TaxID=2029754 RepID=UPI00195B2FFA|nr:hypothetical protein [Herpetosiphon giganteus]MBM7844976.1 hypothetical protein [Herpetosiphon giganteus]
MQAQTTQLPWEQTDWFSTISSWIEQQLSAHGRQLNAPIELIHQRPWSAFAQISTNQGLVYFKAPAPAFSYEAGLTQALAMWQPACNVPVLAIEPSQGWILSADAGTTLRQLGQNASQLAHWDALLPQYSELQIQLAARVPALLDLGLPDRRLAHFLKLFAELLNDHVNLLIDQEFGLSTAEHQQLHALQPIVQEQCQALAGFGLPETLTHEEIHENNVLYAARGYTFTDWSDCSVSHPFFSMLVTLRAAAHWLKLDEQGPELQRLRDAYLEPWTQFTPRQQLDQALDLAYRLGMINRALSWRQALNGLDPAQTKDYQDNVSGWLQDYLAIQNAG